MIRLVDHRTETFEIASPLLKSWKEVTDATSAYIEELKKAEKHTTDYRNM